MEDLMKMTDEEKNAEIIRLRERVTDLQGKLGEHRDAKLSQRVRKFMLNIKQEVKWTPEVPEKSIVILRAMLIVEECVEMLCALYGPHIIEEVVEQVIQTNTSRPVNRAHAPNIPSGLGLLNVFRWVFETLPLQVDLPEFADALSDMRVVITGADAAFGINGDTVDEIVMNANDLKITGPVAPSGKREKPPGWVPPDVAGALKTMGWQESS